MKKATKLKRPKNRIRTNSIRTIKKSLPRFFSLMIMSMLGVFAFSGLQATAPDMLNTLDKYLDDYNTYDIKVVSTTGLVDEDIDELKNIDGIEEAEGSYSKDVMIENGNKETIINISSMPEDINKLEIIDGNLPQNDDEIVVEPNMLSEENLKIGDVINLNDDGFNNKEAKIVGAVKSSTYFNSTQTRQERGKTSLGSGTINYYAYMPSQNFKQNYYNSAYITVSEAKEKNTSNDDYKDLIDNATTKIKDIGHSNWYIYDRTDDSTYSDYLDDADSIKNLSKIFPVVFFAVAILVSLISMNKMVEEDRTEIGTLKSLGFRNKDIMKKYTLFSLLATIIGSIIGATLGLIILPTMIFNIYGLLFDIPNFQMGLNLTTTLLGFVIALICITGTTIITVNKVLKEKPSDLMRPKAPKAGKRVLLERVKFIWNHINFSNKIIIRNIFRYKKRVIVTVGGIAGCTALMLCGFGLRDSITDIPKRNYEEIFKFDAMVYTTNLDENKIGEVFSNKDITKVTPSESISVTVDDISANLVVVENNEALSNVVNLIDNTTGEIDRLEPNKVVITEKLAELENLKVGDKINILDVDNNQYEYTISAIVKNYFDHYIYIDKETYNASGQNYKTNVVYLDTKELSDEAKDSLSSELLSNNQILSISYKEDIEESANNMLKSLNKVVLILIVLASMLAYVVLYNLSNINITERKREIATLKVLGFYDKEVDDYITKENIILTIIGIIIGLILGYFLTNVVVSTVEIERARFIHEIKINSYIYSSILSILFTFIVNIITHFNLKKIDMIESLKSVE